MILVQHKIKINTLNRRRLNLYWDEDMEEYCEYEIKENGIIDTPFYTLEPCFPSICFFLHCYDKYGNQTDVEQAAVKLYSTPFRAQGERGGRFEVFFDRPDLIYSKIVSIKEVNFNKKENKK